MNARTDGATAHESRHATSARRRALRRNEAARLLAYLDDAGDLGAALNEARALIEEAALLRALRTAKGNRTHAAEILGVDARTMRRRLRAHPDLAAMTPEALSDLDDE